MKIFAILHRKIRLLIYKVLGKLFPTYHHLFHLGSNLKLRYPLSSSIGYSLFVQKSFEEGELAYIRQAIPLGGTVVDVGANGGIFTLIAAYCVGKNGKVIAVEPSKREVELLRQNIALNDLGHIVKVVEKALSDYVGTDKLAIVKDSGLNSFVPRKSVEGEVVFWQNVEVTTLDQLTKDLGIKSVDMIKIDVEGAEHKVLAGARDVLRLSQTNLSVRIATLLDSATHQWSFFKALSIVEIIYSI